MIANLEKVDFNSSMIFNDEIHAAIFNFPENFKSFSTALKPLITNRVREDTKSILIKKKSTFHRFR